ncbi:hypothetical protein GOODEAATRI_019326, partial [Goodea atripinnis]
DDKDLVPEFVASEGLTCFIKVGAEADHNYQNYILRERRENGKNICRRTSLGYFSEHLDPDKWITDLVLVSVGPVIRPPSRGWKQSFIFTHPEKPQRAESAPQIIGFVWQLDSSVETHPSLCVSSALSQIMLFVDGMNGVINHNETVQWLYTLTGSLVSPTHWQMDPVLLRHRLQSGLSSTRTSETVDRYSSSNLVLCSCCGKVLILKLTGLSLRQNRPKPVSHCRLDQQSCGATCWSATQSNCVSLQSRLLVKTALKLLIVFVEYSESNSPLVINAVNRVDTKRGVKPWTNIMEVLEEKNNADTELLIFTMTLINKVTDPSEA